MNIPVNKIEYYCKQDLYSYNDSLELFEIGDRINSGKNVIRVYSSDNDYVEVPINLIVPTVLHSLGLVVFPTIEIATSWLNEIENYNDYTFTQIMDILYEVTCEVLKTDSIVDDLLVIDKGIVKKIDQELPFEISEGFYTVVNFDRKLLNERTFYTCDNKDDYIKMEKVYQLSSYDINTIESVLINDYVEIYQDYLKTIDMTTNSIVFEIVQRNDSVYVYSIVIPSTNTEWCKDLIYSKFSGRLLTSSEFLYNCFKEDVMNPTECFTENNKDIIGFTFYNSTEVSLKNSIVKNSITITRAAGMACLSSLGVKAISNLFGTMSGLINSSKNLKIIKNL